MSVPFSSYPVPSHGPVGKQLNALGRHPFRPAHIHFIIRAPGFVTLVTALYFDGDKYIDSARGVRIARAAGGKVSA